jgi:hypothetical protein
MLRSLKTVALVAMLVAIAVGLPRSASGDKPVRPIVVVVAKSSKITGLSMAELRRCFSGDPVVVADQRLMPFNYPPGSAERIAFDRAVLEMSPEEVGRFWVDRKIRGQGLAPRALPSATYVMKIVAKFPGAIGYLPADQLTADVQAISIEGASPGSPDYPIKLR